MRFRLVAGALAVVLSAVMSAESAVVDRDLLRWMRRSPVIKTIAIEGNEHISDAEIKDQMYSKERTFWHGIKGDRSSRLRRETLNRDTLEIKYLYYQRGFLGVKVDERFEMDEADSSVVVRVTIDEGRRYFYGEKRLTGDFPEAFIFHFDKLTNELTAGDPINPLEIQQTSFAMKTYMANHGYPYATVGHRVDTAGDRWKCPVVFDIESDSLVTFGAVTIEGSSHFPGYVARRELTIEEGDIYRRDDILKSQRRLYESGYFSSFTLAQSPNSLDRLKPDFTLRVRERKRHYITTNTGAVGQSDLRDLSWVFGLGFGKRDLFGSRRIDISSDYYFSIGSDTRLTRHIYSVKFTEPWFLGIRMPMILTGELRPKVRSEKQEAYDIQSWSVSASTLKNFGPYVRTHLGLEYQSLDISGISKEEIPIIKERDGRQERRRLYFTYRRDSRNNQLIPRRGTVADLSSEYFGGFLGGDADFVKVQASLSRFLIVWPGWISATRFRVGWVSEFGTTEIVPAEDRFYLGGANTIRGFKERSLGPLAGDTAVGARYLIVFNQEFRWKTIQVLKALPAVGGFFKSFPLYQSVFFDMGNGFARGRDIDFSDFAYSYGTGVQLGSPAGPIRVDYARRIETRRYDVDYRWHFTILYAF
jgi:outer membrane protein insertion porin family